MKFLLGAVVASFLCLQILAITDDDFKNAKKKCEEQVVLTDEDFEKETDKLKSYYKCLLEEVGVLEGNALNEEKLKDLYEIGNPEKKDKAQEIAQECSKKQEEKPEETAFAAIKCMDKFEMDPLKNE